MFDSRNWTKNEIIALSSESANRELTRCEVLALHEAVRKLVNEVEERISCNINDEDMIRYFTNVDIWAHMTPRPHLDSIEYHVVDHCNLNCASCGHFSSIAEEHFTDLEKFRFDYSRFAQVMGDKLKGIIFMGGEPLLHPRIEQFIMSAREIFPIGTIDMFTNGTLLQKMQEVFWRTCAEYETRLIVSAYPIKIDIDEIMRIAAKYGVLITIAERSGDNWVFWTLDLGGKENIYKSFILCSQANNCHQLKDGRLYPCSVTAYIEYFNKAFGKSLNLCDADSLDIYSNISADDVLNFLSRPVPFCRYCKRDKFELTHWKVSSRNIDEWLGNPQSEDK